jgi:integrase
MARKKRAKSRATRCWSQSVGEYGCTVRVYELYPGGNLYRSVWIGDREDKKTLGHKDRKRALAQAHELVASLRALEGPVDQDSITLGLLLARYFRSESHAAKGERACLEDERKLRRIVAFFGPARKAVSLAAEDVHRFTRARRKGDPSLLGVKPERTVGNRTIEADLVALRTMLNWGRKVKNADGVPLLSASPLYGVAFPKEINPRRPIITEEDYLQLLEAAWTVSPLLEAALVVAEGTGRRLSAWRRLRWRNIRFGADTHGAIHWPGEFDKGGLELLRPISKAVRDALLAIRPENPAPEAWVFPAPEDPRKACRAELLDGWLRAAYKQARLQLQPGGMWHPFRRKWVTERKGYPLADIAAAGGWRDERSLKSYLQEDSETVRKVVLEPTHRLRRGA